MIHAIRVQKNTEHQQVANPDLFVRNFNDVEEFKTVLNLFDNKRRISWLESLVIPVRTDNVQNFCKDLFLPGFFNTALKTSDLALKIFFCIMTPIFDIISLPIRLITVIPRYIYNTNHPKESHPFYQYLIRNGVAAEDLNDGYVYLETEFTKDRRGLGQFESGRNISAQRYTFNFMQLPKSVSNIRYELTRTSVFDRPQQQLQIEVVD